MRYKTKYDIGDSTKIVLADDVAEYLRILSYHNTWIMKFPKIFIELLNDNYKASMKAIKYAPAIYFHLNSNFKKDKQLIKATVNSYIRHGRFDEITYNKYMITKKC